MQGASDQPPRTHPYQHDEARLQHEAERGKPRCRLGLHRQHGGVLLAKDCLQSSPCFAETSEAANHGDTLHVFQQCGLRRRVGGDHPFTRAGCHPLRPCQRKRGQWQRGHDHQRQAPIHPQEEEQQAHRHRQAGDENT
ncbi:hypothetical protein D3C71_1568910 [compost metagenome]